MKNLELLDEEEAALAIELVQPISRAQYPFSDRVRTLVAILKQAEAGAGPTSTPAATEGLCELALGLGRDR